MKKAFIFTALIIACTLTVHAKDYKGLIGKKYNDKSDLKELDSFSSRGGSILFPVNADTDPALSISFYENKRECLIIFDKPSSDQDDMSHIILNIINVNVPAYTNYMFTARDNILGIVDFTKKRIIKLWKVTATETSVKLVELPVSRGEYSEADENGDGDIWLK